MSEYIVDYRWLRSRIFGQVEHLTDGLTEIVRCRDCQYCDEERSLCCKWFDWIPVEPDGFCAWGERMED